MAKKPDWLPDWKDPKQYPNHKDDFNMWAWEFLRRNPKYQADWDSLGIGHTESPAVADVGFAIDARLVTVESPPREGSIYKKAVQLGEYWGLFHGPIEDPKHVKPIGSWGPVFWKEPLVIEHKDLQQPGYGLSLEDLLYRNSTVVVVIDLGLSIDKQLKKLGLTLREKQKKLIENEQIRSSRNRTQKGYLYKRYLRVLDATAAKVDPLEISKVLAPNELEPVAGIPEWKINKEAVDIIEGWLKAAKKLVNEDFLHIAPRVRPIKGRGK